MASPLLIFLGCVHRKLEIVFEEGGGREDVKLPSLLPVAVEYTDGHSKESFAHSWPQTPLALYDRIIFCFLMSSLES